MSTPSYFDRHPQSTSTLPTRPGPSPHTPGRTSSAFPPLTPSTSNLASPALSYRHPGTASDTDDPVIFSLSTRFLCAGFGGETASRCRIAFDTALRRRVGDYSAYIPDEGLKKTRKKRKKGKVDAPAWGVEVEGWSMDLHSSRSKVGQAANGERGGRAGISVGLTGDLVERAVREAYTRSLLLDSKTRKAVLVLPEVLPRELVAKVLRVLFEGQMVEIPSFASSNTESIKVPFGALADVVEDTFFTPSPSHQHQNDKPDDQEPPLPQLLFKCLLALPPDVRAVCMSGIMFTGSGSNIPGFKQRVVDEVSALVQQRGFDPVEGKAADERRRRERETAAKRREAARKSLPPVAEDGKPSASEAPQVIDEIDVKLMKQAEKFAKPTVTGMVRGIETLGAWAGASLFGGLRVKGVVVVERDAFLQNGMAGANKRDSGPAGGVAGMGAGRKSYAGTDVTGRAGGIEGERSGWTLGAWA
ncbi:MAG: hypothetical protein OHK93_006844 [Ramalina farinacea]|uniref:Actin-like ATPase domain-containing protein n=1 Tax=Ramalina farinacea TaxID=258253 RepID=A0AA43TTW0_9LECA|nr:hypothetical protein [Ramalina farinacea]